MKQSVPRRTAEDYAQEIANRFPDSPTRQLTVLIWWAQHDPDVWRALGIESWLDTLEPCAEPLKARLRSLLNAASRPQSVPETEEHRRAFEDYLKAFRP